MTEAEKLEAENDLEKGLAIYDEETLTSKEVIFRDKKST